MRLSSSVCQESEASAWQQRDSKGKSNVFWTKLRKQFPNWIGPVVVTVLEVGQHGDNGLYAYIKAPDKAPDEYIIEIGTRSTMLREGRGNGKGHDYMRRYHWTRNLA